MLNEIKSWFIKKTKTFDTTLVRFSKEKTAKKSIILRFTFNGKSREAAQTKQMLSKNMPNIMTMDLWC